MYLLKEGLKFPKTTFVNMKHMPFEIKPSFSAKRIVQWHEHWGGLIYIAFSGGLDSTVLAHLVCTTYKEYGLTGEIPLVFSDTGVEFPEIRKFVKEYVAWLKMQFPELNITLKIIYPKHNFKWICEHKGFPLISKDTASKIKKLRHGKLSEKYRNYLLNGDERGKFGMLAKKWQYLADKRITEEDISDICCEILKKEPFKRYVRETGRYPFIGITQDEGFRRENQYNHTGCNVYDGTTIKSQPLGFWTNQDVLQYKMENEIPICCVYGEIKKNQYGIYELTGEQRTGCVICGFGCHLEAEPNRIQRLGTSPNETHRELYNWGMKIKNNGVTYQKALEHCGVATETWESVGQMNLADFLNEERNVLCGK
ncbi:phosphoadenosine phosphosulfate reductase family protein [Lacrimispora sp.]|uniref:phosphoadenosine phosphosulfate reductase family protein n=1 Tax=Lacrimispora sp. TaxID=2719234 RepID=UPI0034605889